MTQQEFFQLAQNRNTYKVVKTLDGELSYAKVGDKFLSDTLYDRGYNINQLVQDGFLELMPRIFPFEKEVVGENIHSVITVCPQCGSHGVNMPLEKECGNCGYTETRTYYDAETIHNLLQSASQPLQAISEEEGVGSQQGSPDGKPVASHTASSGNSMEQYLKRRIKELNEADAKFCHDRWDNPAADSFLKMLSREESNKVTFARQELETVLKMINQQ